jgi:glucose/arabinose dehydrogenase
VARYQVSPDPDAADPATAAVILFQPQPYANHNGGHLVFGPDGYLWIGLGDGGSANDPQNRAQDPQTLLGKMLRLDVDGGFPYVSPPDNLFAAAPEVWPEIWATGLRNPWRYSFDRLTGDLYVADVGQNAYEEINFVPAGTGAGPNFGWRVTEGAHCARNRACDFAGYTLPVAEYSHDDGCSVTGGHVYRGAAFPAMQGFYLSGDYCSGRIWALAMNPDGSWAHTVVLRSSARISSFGEDEAGELYLADHAGTLYQVTAP